MGMLLLEMVASRGKPLTTMLNELMAAPDIGYFHYARLDQQVPPFNKKTLVSGLMASLPETLAGQPLAHVSDRDGVKYIFHDDSWLLIRPSGTEPVLRIYAEAASEGQVEELLKAGVGLAEAQIAALARA